MLVSSLGVALFPPAPHSALPPRAGVPSRASPNVHVGPGHSSSVAPDSPPEPPTPTGIAARALAAASTEGIPARFVYVPSPSVTSPQIHSAATSGHITPPDLGQTITAAMGIGEYGLSAGVGGSLEPYDLNTTSLEANLSTNKTGLQPLYVLDSTPDAYSAELNAVLEDVTLFGNQTYQFWVQDIVLYYAQSHSLYLVSNIWDFSTPLLPPHAIVANGTNGSFRGLPFFYYSVSRLPNIAYPFNVTLFLNSTMIAGNDSVDFSAVLSAGGGTPVSYPFDFVEFNSTAPGIAPGTKPAVFDANGFTYTPTGHPYDFEFVLGGPGGGSQANFYAAGATMSLDYWNGTTRSYVAVPSALSYGSNSGESASGVNIEWTNATSGPHAIVSGGPSILTGLWNASGPPGVATIQTNVQPTDAFLFLNESANSFTGDAPVWAPTMLNSNVSVAPGTYTTSATLSYYSSTTEPIRVVAGQSVPFDPTLALDPASEVTTPIWVWNDSQFPALSSGGDGTNATPYLIRDGQVTPMASRFGEMNDFGFPVFSGVFFVGTHVSAELLQPGPFETDVPASSIYPPTNDLSYVFYDSTNVSVANASNISGWFSNSLYWNDSTPSAPNGPVLQTPYYTYATFNMVFWNSSHNLVANDTFNTESDGIYLAGGYNNTIWGSTFRWSPMSGPLAPNLWPRARAIGIQDAENGDLVYNNAVYTQTTAVNPGYNMYTGAPANYSDRWNRTYTTDTSLTYFAPGFNIPLSGSIVNGAYQGGNFWWNYGLPGNLMVTPPLYTDYGKISPGDYHPLTETFGLTFLEHGYNFSGTWGVQLSSNGGSLSPPYTTTTSSLAIAPVNVSDYAYTVVPPANWTSTPASGTVTISGITGSQEVLLNFTPVNGTLAGTVQPADATVYVNGAPISVNATNGTFNASLAVGEYTLSAEAANYTTWVDPTNVTIVANNTTHVAISLVRVNGTLVGTIAPATGALAIDGRLDSNISSSGQFNLTLPWGPHTYYLSASGYNSLSGEVNVTPSRTTYLNLTLTQSGRHGSALTSLDLELLGIVAGIVVVILAVVLIRMQRARRPPESPPDQAPPATAETSHASSPPESDGP